MQDRAYGTRAPHLPFTHQRKLLQLCLACRTSLEWCGTESSVKKLRISPLHINELQLPLDCQTSLEECETEATATRAVFALYTSMSSATFRGVGES